jgi:hypothetical protein
MHCLKYLMVEVELAPLFKDYTELDIPKYGVWGYNPSSPPPLLIIATPLERYPRIPSRTRRISKSPTFL